MDASPLFIDPKGRTVTPPAFRVPLADTHAHLDMLEDPALALARAAHAGVTFIATVADVTEDAYRTYAELALWRDEAAQLLESWGAGDLHPPGIRIIVGAHPHNAKTFDASARSEMLARIADKRTCAIGEIGLDYHYDHSPRDVQRAVMRVHLDMAHEAELPVVIHLREAHEDGLEILREEGVPAAGAILHCYTLDAQVMQPFLDLGCHVSFAGPVTFKKADEIRAAAAAVPAGRILTETDCPFMAPEPFRGSVNEPALVVFTANRIAEARNESPDEFARHSFAAATHLLDRIRP